jgi:hypothetical protein
MRRPPPYNRMTVEGAAASLKAAMRAWIEAREATTEKARLEALRAYTGALEIAHAAAVELLHQGEANDPTPGPALNIKKEIDSKRWN